MPLYEVKVSVQRFRYISKEDGSEDYFVEETNFITAESDEDALAEIVQMYKGQTYRGRLPCELSIRRVVATKDQIDALLYPPTKSKKRKKRKLP